MINIIAIPTTHLLIAWWSTALPARFFTRNDTPRTTPPNPIYDRLFRIRRWKHLLPDGALWLNGFPKEKLQSIESEYLRTFIRETRRGEFSHWVQTLCIASFISWNPYPANLIILAYAGLSNFPCILNLRYTRQRMHRLLHQITTR
ncbi:MAG: hypothetical protein KJO21_02835 [Verrucomicrobiae bacterium]|nr:hypothetical protein [Verrucomicrobiae bacterium]NNJ41853.1 hypothetical protein [Akkermansiaceae bacterium]